MKVKLTFYFSNAEKRSNILFSVQYMSTLLGLIKVIIIQINHQISAADIYDDKMFWMPIFNQPNAAVDWTFNPYINDAMY